MLVTGILDHYDNNLKNAWSLEHKAEKLQEITQYNYYSYLLHMQGYCKHNIGSMFIDAAGTNYSGDN